MKVFLSFILMVSGLVVAAVPPIFGAAEVFYMPLVSMVLYVAGLVGFVYGIFK